MSVRKYIEERLGGFLDFVDMLSTAIDSSTNTVTAKVRGDVYESTSEEYEDAEVWGVAGVLSRPKADSGGDSGAQAVAVRQGDEMFVVATRDTRYQVSAAEGEVVVHALGKDGTAQAVLRLQAGGKVIVEADEILLGSDSASTKIALKSDLDSLKTWVDSHTHSGVTAGGGTSGTPATGPSPSPTASSKVKAV